MGVRMTCGGAPDKAACWFDRGLRLAQLLSIPAAFAVHAATAAAQPPASVRVPVGEAESAREPARSASQQSETEEERRERIAAERFLQVLQRRPRTGTALDRLYGYHVQNGSIDELENQLRQSAEADAENGAAWMLLGLVQLRRGDELDAISSLQRATEALPDDAMAPFYLGRAHALLGTADRAAEAMEEALRRSPPRTELLEIGKTLGRLYQRQQQPEKAARVWQQLTDQFADDPRVTEAVATILAEEGDYASALERFTALAAAARDPFRRVQYAVRAAEMKLRLGDRQQARSDLEAQLGRLNPDSWLYRDVRRRIEASFTDAGDYDGLAQYYANWIQTHPDDVDAMLRAGRVLALQGRMPEAQQWFQKAIRRAPSESEPREALIGALLGEEKFAEAAALYAQLHELAPDDPDVIIRWGETLLADRQVPEAQRRKAAAEVWERLVQHRGDDAVTASQVADLMRAAEQSQRAIELYQKAIELAPDAPQYREYLGEYLHRLDRHDEALRVWTQLAEGPRRTRENLVRLAEVFSTFDYPDRALAAMGEACAMDPTLAQRLRYAKLLRDGQQYAEAEQQLQLAAPQAETPEERDQLLAEQIALYQAAGELPSRITAARQAVSAAAAKDADAWVRLARLLQADRQYDEAAAAAGRALEFAPRSIAAWTTAAEMRERSGRLGEAIEAYERLAEIDQRHRTAHLIQTANLHVRLGQIDQAMAAGRTLLTAGATNPDNYRFFADLCFRMGEDDAGLDALRRGVRAAPNDRQAVTTLAEALARQFRTDEAIELYWQSFQAADDLDVKSATVTQLAELYTRSGRIEQLIERLEISGREGRDGEGRRQADLLIAAVHEAIGDTGTARQLLDALLASSPRDTALLQRLVNLAARDNDTTAAAEYQRALNRVAPSREGDSRLARFLIDLGEIEQAEAIWMRLSHGEDAEQQLLSTIDGAMQRGQWETAVKIGERLLADQPNDWETMARLAIAYRMSDGHESQRAANVARQLLDIALPRETLGREAQQELAKAAARGSRVGAASQPSLPISFSASNAAYIYRPLLTPQGTSNPFGGSVTSTMRSQIRSFHDARMAAIAVLLGVAQEAKQTDALLDALEEKAKASAADARGELAWWDLDGALMMLVTLSPTDQALADRLLRVAGQLAERAGSEGKLRYVMVMTQPRRTATDPAAADAESDPLSDATLDKIVAYTEEIIAEEPLHAMLLLGRGVVDQLLIAKRNQQASQLVDRAVSQPIDGANAAMFHSMQFAMAARLGDRQRFRQLLTGAAEQRRYAISALTQFAQQALQDEGIEQVVSEDIDLLVDLVTAAYEDLRPSQRAAIANSSSSSQVYVQPVVGTQVVRSMQRLEFPPPTPVWDSNALRTLHLIGSVAKVAERDQELVDRLRVAKRDGESAARHMVRLSAAAFLLHWHDAADQSTQVLTEALAADPSCNALRVVLARLRYDSGDTVGALQVVEAIQPLSSQLLQERELAMLQLASQLGDRDRARQAARRLYAMRLDAETQLLLTRHMTALGMNDLADNLVRRIQQRSGNDTRSLREVMRGLQSMGKTDAAAEVATQLLARTGGSSTNSDSDQYLRREAVQVLSAAGRMQPLIERLERQAAAAPKSVRLATELAELYTAAGQRDKAAEALKRLGSSASESPDALIQLGQQFTRTGEHAKANEAFVSALRQQPDLLARHFYTFRTSLASDGGYKTLIEAILDSGVDKYQNSYYYMSNVIREAWKEEDNRPTVRRLWLVMFEAGPQMAGAAIDAVASTNGVLEDPEIFEKLRDALLSADAFNGPDPWSLLNGSVSISSGGNINGVLTRLAGAAATNLDPIRRLADLTDTSHRSNPEWPGMRALAGALAAAVDRPQRAAELIEPLLSDQNPKLDARIAWQLGIVCQEKKPLAELGVRLLRHAIAHDTSTHSDHQFSPQAALTVALQKAGQHDEARRMLLASIEAADVDATRYPPGYVAYRRFRSVQGVAEQLLQMEFPLDAMLLCQRTLDDEQLIADAGSYQSSLDRSVQQLQQMRERAESKLTPNYCLSILVQRIDASLTPQAAPGEKTKSDAEPDLSAGAADQLMELLQPQVPGQDLERLKIESLLTLIVRRAAAADEGPEQLRKLSERVAQAAGDGAPTLAETTLHTVLRSAAGDASELAAAIQQIGEQIASSTAAGTAQEATVALAAWPAIVAGLDREPPIAEAAVLADRLVRLPQLKANPVMQLALLREQNAIALRHQRKQQADQHLQAMADLLLQSGDPQERAEQTLSPSDRTKWGLELAELAIKQGAPAVSIAAVRGALADGPPLPAVPAELVLGRSRTSAMVVRSSSQAPPPISEAEDRVGRLLVQLSEAWQEHAIPAQQAYEALRDVILPADGSAVHAYLVSDDSSATSSGMRPTTSSGRNRAAAQIERQSGLAELVRWAVRAGRQEDLSERFQHLAEAGDANAVAADVGSVLLALEGTPKLADAAPLERLAGRLSGRSDAYTTLLISQAAIPAFESDTLAPAAAGILRQLLPQLGAAEERPRVFGRDDQLLSERLGRRLVAVGLKRGDVQAAHDVVLQLISDRHRRNAPIEGYGDRMEKQLLADVVPEFFQTASAAKVGVQLLQRYDQIAAPDGSGRTVDALYGKIAAAIPSLSDEEAFAALRLICLPKDAKTPLRLGLDFAPYQPVPPTVLAAAGLDEKDRPPTLRAAPFTGTFVALLLAADRSGAIDSLVDQLQAMHQAGRKDADIALALALNHAGRDVPVDLLQRMAETIKQQVPAKQNNQLRPHYGHLAVAVSLARREPPVPLAAAMLEDLRQHCQQSSFSDGRTLINDVLHDLAGPDPNLRPIAESTLWTTASDQVPTRNPVVAARWLAGPRQLMHVCGEYHDYAFLRLPLGGDYDLTWRQYDGGWQRAEAVVAGAIVSGRGYNQTLVLHAFGGRDTVTYTQDFIKKNAAYQMHLRVRGDVRELRINDRLVYREQQSDTSFPFVGWQALHHFATPIEEITFDGSPRVLDEVALLRDPRLRGWTSFRSLAPMSSAGVAEPEGLEKTSSSLPPPTEIVWEWTDGELHGNRNVTPEPRHVALHYMRPLNPGDRIAYEFFYELGTAEVHPVLDNVAMVLQADAVRLRWLGNAARAESFGPAPDRLLDDPQGQLHSGSLPLKPKAWNKLQIVVLEDHLRVELNGTPIYRYNDVHSGAHHRRFGFTFDASATQARVRNAMLRGDWPKTFPASLMKPVAIGRR